MNEQDEESSSDMNLVNYNNDCEVSLCERKENRMDGQTEGIIIIKKPQSIS